MLSTHLTACMRLRVLVGVIALVAMELPGGRMDVGAAEPKTATVRLVIDYGDGVETHFSALPWRDGMTVIDALAAAKGHRRGITYVQRGSGSTAMITKIAELQNEGSGKNWLFYVDGKIGEESAGITKLKAGDTALWRFKEYDYNQDS